jgi:hypothetical protein
MSARRSRRILTLEITLLVLLLCFCGGGVFLYKVRALEISPLPKSDWYYWQISAKVGFEAYGRLARVSLAIPTTQPNFELMEENFISRGFSVATLLVDGDRRAVWSRRGADGSHVLYYDTVVKRDQSLTPQTARRPSLERPRYKPHYREAAEKIVARAKNGRADDRTVVRRIVEELDQRSTNESKVFVPLGSDSPSLSTIIRLCAFAGIPTRGMYGFMLERPQRAIPLESLLDVYIKDSWNVFNLKTYTWEVPENFFPWYRGAGGLLEVSDVKNESIEFSVTPLERESVALIERQDIAKWAALFQSFPVELQAVYRIMLLIPVGALVIIFLRNVIGMPMFGTFMPVLIALSFKETGLSWGLVLFSSIVALGLISRAYFQHLRLLLVPRLAATLTMVIVIVVALTYLAYLYGIREGISIALFPLVILTMTIERMSIMWEELGGIKATWHGVSSLLAATLAYIVITNRFLEYLIFYFPELLLVVLAIMVLLGRYTGYRLSELFRFSSLKSQVTV